MMLASIKKILRNELFGAWAYLTLIAMTILIYLLLCHYYNADLQHIIQQRELLKTILYLFAILLFPITNLIRHIQQRLNETMPLNHDLLITAKKRYLFSIIVSMTLIEIIAVFGLVMFILGDSFNTLYIFELLAALGLFLYRPKKHEYLGIIDKLSQKNTKI